MLDLVFTIMSDNVLSVQKLGNSDHCILKAELDVSLQFNDMTHKKLSVTGKRGGSVGPC